MSTVLELTNVTFRRGKNQILGGISLTVGTGEHWALLGPNGSGKTTILSFFGARAHPTSGIVKIFGGQLGRVELQRLRRHIGHVDPGHHPLRSALSAVQVVLTGITGTIDTPLRWVPSDEEIRLAQEALEDVGLASKIHASWLTLSQGERSRLLIARALITKPRLLLLDEPTTGLDLAAREQFLETVDGLSRRNPDLSTVLVTHHLEELPASITHAAVIARGRVVAAGPVDEVVDSATITKAFEHPISVTKGSDGRWSARTAPKRGEDRPKLSE